VGVLDFSVGALATLVGGGASALGAGLAVSASHRGDAFEACRYAIDTLKRTVPVWKKEHFEDGEVWVGLQGG